MCEKSRIIQKLVCDKKKLNIEFSSYSPTNLGGPALFPSHKIEGCCIIETVGPKGNF